MKKKSQSLTAAELFESLERDEPIGAESITLTGMVKKSDGKKKDGKEKSIQFAAGRSCSNWVTIPLELIEDVEVLKSVPCKDHSHPFVRLTLKTPRTPEAKIFSAILEGVQSGYDGSCGGNHDGGYEGTPASSVRRLVDEWGDPICGPGMRKVCYPTQCPGGGGWCTICQCEPRPIRDPEGFTSFGSFRRF